MIIEKNEKRDNVLTRETMFVCSQCGRFANTHLDLHDVSCYMNAIEVYADSVDLIKGRVIAAVPVIKRND